MPCRLRVQGVSECRLVLRPKPVTFGVGSLKPRSSIPNLLELLKAEARATKGHSTQTSHSLAATTRSPTPKTACFCARTACPESPSPKCLQPQPRKPETPKDLDLKSLVQEQMPPNSARPSRQPDRYIGADRVGRLNFERSQVRHTTSRRISFEPGSWGA